MVIELLNLYMNTLTEYCTSPDKAHPMGILAIKKLAAWGNYLAIVIPKWAYPEPDLRKGALDVTGNANWKTCMWKREEDSSFCLMEYKCVKHCNDPFHTEVWEVDTNCEANLKDVTYFGSDPSAENHICGIVVPNADQEDNSAWTCDVSFYIIKHS